MNWILLLDTAFIVVLAGSVIFIATVLIEAPL